MYGVSLIFSFGQMVGSVLPFLVYVWNGVIIGKWQALDLIASIKWIKEFSKTINKIS
jgi:hypothetical protein